MSENERPPVHSDGWKQWSGQVKESMTKLEDKVDKLETKITKHREEALVDITTLKVKAGIIGLVAGIVSSTIMSILVGLIVYQLTVGINLPKPYQPERPIAPPSDTIGYVLPPNNERHGQLDREDVE